MNRKNTDTVFYEFALLSGTMEDLIRDYFKKNYTYKTILILLEKYHGIKISRSSLLNKLNEYGLK